MSRECLQYLVARIESEYAIPFFAHTDIPKEMPVRFCTHPLYAYDPYPDSDLFAATKQTILSLSPNELMESTALAVLSGGIFLGHETRRERKAYADFTIQSSVHSSLGLSIKDEDMRRGYETKSLPASLDPANKKSQVVPLLESLRQTNSSFFFTTCLNGLLNEGSGAIALSRRVAYAPIRNFKNTVQLRKGSDNRIYGTFADYCAAGTYATLSSWGVRSTFEGGVYSKHPVEHLAYFYPSLLRQSLEEHTTADSWSKWMHDYAFEAHKKSGFTSKFFFYALPESVRVMLDAKQLPDSLLTNDKKEIV